MSVILLITKTMNNHSLLNFMIPDIYEAGCDEAGRGCLAGPVVAAAVILPVDFYHPLLNDSKQVSEKNRDILRPIIEQNSIAWGVAFVDAAEIDKINILQASITAMHRALDKLTIKPEHIIVDGNKFREYKNLSGKIIPSECVVKGDSKYTSIAAASVLAKTHRDEFMKKIHKEFPNYNWLKNKGYPTKTHRDAIALYGPSSFHRMSFTLLPNENEPELF